VEEAKVNKKLERRKRLYEFLGKQKFVQKKYNAQFQECFNAIVKECNATIYTVSILTWWTINESGNITLLLPVTREINKMELGALNLVWSRLRDEQIKAFGLGRDMEVRIKLMQEIVVRGWKMIQNQDNREWTFIKKAQDKLKRLMKIEPKKMSLVELACALERTCKITIDVEKCSVYKFYGYMKLAEKLNESGSRK